LANPRFYFYPAGFSTLQTIELPRVSRLEPVQQPQLTTLTTANLGMVQVSYGVRRLWRITLERDSMLSDAGRARWRALHALVSHLETGGAVGFATDHSKAYAGYSAGSYILGGSYVVWQGNAFAPWNQSAAPVAGDDLLIEQAPMYGRVECHKVASITNRTIALSGTTLQFDHNGTSAIIRNAGFFPALRLAADRYTPPMTNEHGIIHSLDLTLEMDAAIYAPVDAYGLADFGLGSGASPQYNAGGNLEALLSAKRGRTGKASTPRISSAYLLQSSGKVSR